MNIVILGAGAWGTALAISLADRHSVVLWGRDAALMNEAHACRENRAYLPGAPLPASLVLTADFDAALAHACGAGDEAGANADSLLIVASSLAGLRTLATRLQPYPINHLVWLCKGLEEESGLLPHQVVRAVLGNKVAAGALSGPSFAQEVAQGKPCALTIATTDEALCRRVVGAVHGGAMRIYSTDDVVGVEIGGAVKNIMAIATGITDGLGLGLNARAAVVTRGLAEITRLCVALGGRADTMMGLAGIGDLILTCTGDLSRNRRVGLELAAGKSLEAVVAELGHVAEGVRCARAVQRIAQTHNIEMPITDAVARVLFNGESPAHMVRTLLSRDPRGEYC